VGEARQVAIQIERSSPVPLYHQLAEQLTAAVTSGQLQPGDAFENELDLASRLSLSRPTVRRAIQELVAKGLLLRRQGLGTRVANRKVHRRAELTSLYDDLQRSGSTPRTRVLAYGPCADVVAAQALDIPEDTPLLSVVRLRLADSAPFAILRNWLPPAYGDITRRTWRPAASTRCSATGESVRSSPTRASARACRRRPNAVTSS